MRTLSLSPLSRLASLAPLAVRVIAGIIMLAHGWQKLTEMGPGNFGGQMLAGLGVPLPVFTGYVVTLVELIGGILLIVGFLSRLAALLLTIDLVIAILLVKVNVGFLSGSSGTGAELDLALIAGFLVILFAGPGRLSVDHALGLEPDIVADDPSSSRRRARTT
ncbi:MAG: DoxX family protein [Actinobacteria bacterium]|nr:DoxX family protein [Actinomycetota bacterium]